MTKAAFLSPPFGIAHAGLARDERAPTTTVLRFEVVYEEHFSFVWRTCLRLGADPSTLDDLVQEAFLVAHRRLAEFEGRASVPLVRTRNDKQGGEARVTVGRPTADFGLESPFGDRSPLVSSSAEPNRAGVLGSVRRPACCFSAREMGRASCIGLMVAALVVIAGCGDEDPETASNAPDTRVSVPASQATIAELGVSHWSFDSANQEAGVLGYDTEDQMIIAFARQETTTDAARLDRYGLRQKDTVAQLRLQVANGEVVVLESAFTANARRALELMSMDWEAAIAPGTSLSTQGLEPRDLVAKEPKIVVGDACTGLVLVAQGAAFDVPRQCLSDGEIRSVCKEVDSAYLPGTGPCWTSRKQKCAMAEGERDRTARAAQACPHAPPDPGPVNVCRPPECLPALP